MKSAKAPTCFNPRSRTGSDVRSVLEWAQGISFNPRSRTGSDAELENVKSARERASIHAPARGATFSPQEATPHYTASIHAPARGATAVRPQPIDTKDASIHAPARGATRCNAVGCGFMDASIHAPARGATLRHHVHMSTGQLQSTLPHGERQYWTYCAGWMIWASIHAPARGATARTWVLNSLRMASIHAPARGATPIVLLACFIPASFNPRSRTGSDVNCAKSWKACRMLQSTLPHGERRQRGRLGRITTQLQSTLPHGERPDQAGAEI